MRSSRSLGLWFGGFALALAFGAAAETARTLPAAKPAPGNERRVALVIGNSSYKDAPLRNPVNDARAISTVLSETGFTVTVIEDATQAGMRRAIRNFGDELAKASVGIFYYAGHGMQVRGANYLIPVNADIDREDEVADQGVDANLVLAKMDSAKGSLNIMILDACRNNPFARSFRSSARGLAQMDAPSGTLISFATAPGSVASDGSGQNGLYTEHLLKAIRTPGLPIEQVFKQVRIGVTKATADQQIPWESSSLKGDFYFVPPDPSARGVSQEAMQKAVQDANRAADERLARERAEFQKRMEQMIQEALAQQRAQLEAERRAAGGAPAAVAAAAAPAPAPAQLAAAAPSPAPVPAQAASVPAGGGEAFGDRWRYAVADAMRSDRKFFADVEVTGAVGSTVIEVTRSQGPVRQWVYTSAPTLVGGAGPMLMFSPVVGGTQPVQAGQSWRGIAIEGIGMCLQASCTAEARVEGAETVKTAAGTFEALRIDLWLIVHAAGAPPGRSRVTYWYAPKVKRIVKYSGRFAGVGRGLPPADDLDAELTAYRVAGAGSAGELEAGSIAQTAAGARVQVATTAPVANLMPAGTALPKAGDRWDYVVTDVAARKKNKRSVSVASVSGGSVREVVSGDNLPETEVAHAAGAYLVDAGMLQFSPYLGAFGALEAGNRFAEVKLFHVAACGGVFHCTAQARVAGPEKVSVAAGSFDAVKIEVTLWFAEGAARRPLNVDYWYAPAARRIVKASAKFVGSFPRSANPAHDQEIELVGMQLQ
jgi:uncharacterized caspase-like protein